MKTLENEREHRKPSETTGQHGKTQENIGKQQKIQERIGNIEKEMGYSHVIDKMTIAGKVFCKKLIFHNVCHGLCKKTNKLFG